MHKLLDILAAAAILAIMCTIANGCATPVGLTWRPPSITIEAPADNAN